MTCVNQITPRSTELTKSMPLILRPHARFFQSLMRAFVLRWGTWDVERRRNYRMLPLLAVGQGSDITRLCYHSNKRKRAVCRHACALFVYLRSSSHPAAAAGQLPTQPRRRRNVRVHAADRRHSERLWVPPGF